MIGNQLTTDILFGNLNNMVTIWAHRWKNYFEHEKFKVEGFNGNLEKSITEDGFKEIHLLEK